MSGITDRERHNRAISEGMNESFGKAEKIQRLKDAADIGCPHVEQYSYAGISKATYYEWRKEDPELADDLDRRKEATLRMIARKNVAEAIKTGQIDSSWKFLERRDPEMRPATKTEHSGKIETEAIGPANEKTRKMLDDYLEFKRKHAQENPEVPPPVLKDKGEVNVQAHPNGS